MAPGFGNRSIVMIEQGDNSYSSFWRSQQDNQQHNRTTIFFWLQVEPYREIAKNKGKLFITLYIYVVEI